MGLIVDPPAAIGSASASAVPFTVTGEDAEGDDSGSVVFSDGTNSVTVPLTAGQTTGTADLSTLADSPISSTLSLTDTAGNTFGATGNNVTLDQDLGDSVSLSGPGFDLGSVDASSAAFVVTGNLDGDESGPLTLSDGSGDGTTLAYTGDGTYTADLSGWADNTVNATLTVSEENSNSFTATSSGSIDPDFGESVRLHVDSVQVGSVIGSANAGALDFTVTGEDSGGDDSGVVVFSDGGGHHVTVSLTAGQTFDTADLRTLNDGPITSTLSLTDSAGNTFGASGNVVTLDQDTGEHVSLHVDPPIGSLEASAVPFTVTGEDSGNDDVGGRVVFTSSGGGSYTATLTAGQTAGTADLSGLGDGSVSSTLSLTDTANNSFSATGNVVTLDQDLGESVSVSGPATTLGSAGASAVAFTITGEDAGSDDSGSYAGDAVGVNPLRPRRTHRGPRAEVFAGLLAASVVD